MKSLIPLLILAAFIISCHQKAETPCHAQAIREQIMPVYMADSYFYKEHFRTRIRCAGKCADGAPCDSLIELTNTSMGASVRRVKCGCGNQRLSEDCEIVIEHTRYSPDTTVTRLLCAHGAGCPVQSDTCMLQEQRLPSDTIRSSVTNADSLIIMKWVTTCECMEK